EDARIGVRDAQHPAAVAAFGVEDAGQEATLPCRGALRGPGTDFLDTLELWPRARPDAHHPLSSGKRFLEEKFPGRDRELLQVRLRAPQRFEIHERETELILISVRPARSLVSAGPQQRVPTDHAAQISALVSGV